ncbi:SDR family oxidoreductase [Henriciella sp. AS95]|uniref:SDR family oxidoreductase n=1 Tax=Henriciella sp. AS95 TaxID=3135782 RepID=UPI003181E31B
MKLSGNTILITGGGSGIGRALAHRFHDLGNTVIVAGRTKAKLDDTIAGRDRMHAMTFDAGDAGSIEDLTARVLDEHPALNVLMNNAGIMRYEDLLADPVDVEIAEATIATNLLGPIRLTSALLPHLRAQPRASVVNVTSGLAFVPWTKTAAYNATKAGLHSWTVALRHKLRQTSVDVIEIAPPAVQTELTPGQSTREGYMPLEAFIDETMANFEADPDARENLVKNVHFLRFAEAEGRFYETVEQLNEALGG